VTKQTKDEEFAETLTNEGEPGPANGNGNGHAVRERTAPPPTAEAPEQALARQQAE